MCALYYPLHNVFFLNLHYSDHSGTNLAWKENYTADSLSLRGYKTQI